MKQSSHQPKELTLFFLLFQVSALSPSAISPLRSPAPMIPTSLSVSTRVVLSNFLLTKSPSHLRFAHLRITKRLLSFLISFGMPYLLFFHSESLSIFNKSSQISSHLDPNVNILSNWYVKTCHKNYYIFTYHLYEILGYQSLLA